ncbi:NACHT domain-containing protein [cf. Phormidesmis sp. LEGE 11477]|uniref:NACHT domain-containing protein n=1 Tax=cf. Phormidesmis sp. LEGE 11477 TaxID=1828680 RepID=UPI00188048BA|nr:NACHT domain-containing protein [cf. Phormidesmis sp. LEGE 11477]MBE9061881.1 NACHT domain-containing protein [cf. Phormidesmis sp. LEGE 11477]
MDSGQLFEQADQQWNMARLCADLAAAKANVMPHKRPDLTEVEQIRLRGLLLGYSPTEIAEQQYTATRTVEVALSQGLYRYVEVLVERDRNTLTSWRDVATWLEAAGYRGNSVAVNWAQMPDVPVLYGRDVELDQLKNWILGASPCRLVTINGPAGIGKTSLAIRLAKAAQANFDGVIWQSLRHKPQLQHVLSHWQAQLPEPFSEGVEWYDQLQAVMTYLSEHRCLIVLDNLESILSGGSLIGEYEAGYESYRELLKRLGEEPHKSCIIVTSRESNRELKGSATSLSIRHLALKGLHYEAAECILAEEALSAQSYWKLLVKQYQGNPLMLRIVAMTIQEVFDGDVRSFLKQRMTLFGDIEYLIDQQYERLSDEERDILYQLAERAEPVQPGEMNSPHTLPAVSALLRRSLIEKSAAGFTLRPMVMEYVRLHLP